MSELRRGKGKNGNYEVGYRKPPKRTQFKKGVSGNPKGRRRVVPSFADTLRTILTEKVSVQVDGRVEKHSKFILMTRSLVARAIKGDPSAARQAFNLMEKFGLLKLEQIQHLVTVEFVQPPDRPRNKISLDRGMGEANERTAIQRPAPTKRTGS